MSSRVMHKKTQRDLIAYPPMTREEEADASRDGRYWDLVLHNMRFAVTRCRPFLDGGRGIDDVLPAVYVGMLRSAKEFDPAREKKFISFAVYRMRSDLKIDEGESAGPVSVPPKVSAKTTNAVLDVIAPHITSGRQVDPRHVAKEAGVSEYIARTVAVLKLDHPSYDNEGADLAGKFHDHFDERFLNKDAVDTLLSCLSPRSEKVVRLRYGLYSDDMNTMTFPEIGKIVGISKQRALQIINESFAKIRKLQAQRELMGVAS